MGYILARIHELKAELAAMPEVDPATREVTKLEAIRQLEPEIAGLRKKGYRLDGVITLLAARGVPITVGTLRTYLRRLDKQRKANAASSASATAAERSENTPATHKERMRRPEQWDDDPAREAAGNNGATPAETATTPRQSTQRRQRHRSENTPPPTQEPTAQPAVTPMKPDVAAVGTGRPSAEIPPPPARYSGSSELDPGRATAALGTPGPPPHRERLPDVRATPVTSTKASFAPREDSEEI